MNDAMLFAPEVIQTSATDCGPASLKSVLEGFGIASSYGRLREACQTDIDGSSISTIGDVALQLGLEAEEIILPFDHLWTDAARALPAIIVARLPSGFTHFLVLWRRYGNTVQVMDPAVGRRWVAISTLERELFTHQVTVPAGDWREWVATDEFRGALIDRITRLGIAAEPLIAQAASDAGWRTFAAVDAAVRTVEALSRNGAIDRGSAAGDLVQRLVEDARLGSDTIPPAYWSVRPCEPVEGEDQSLRMRGAVLIRFRGKRDVAQTETGPLSADTLSAVRTAPAGAWSELWRLLRGTDHSLLATMLVAICVAAAGVIFEAVLFRALLDVDRKFIFEQRAIAAGGVAAFLLTMLLLDVPLAAVALRLGRRLECRLRLALYEKLPRLADRYFRSRLTSDMVERTHSTHLLSNLVTLASRVCRSSAKLIITAAAMCWIDPRSTVPTLVTAIFAAAIPMAGIRLVNERELRVRTHAGALSRFSLDALLGLVAIRAHSAERSIRRQHQTLLAEWMRASLRHHRATALLETSQTFLLLALVGWLVIAHVTAAGAGGINLLLVFWALSLPVLGQEIAVIVRQAPTLRNITARLLELLNAPEEKIAACERTPREGGAEITFRDVAVRIAGRDVLRKINLQIPGGMHVAVIGASGAGKSTLVGTLLGFHSPSSGELLIDGERLDSSSLQQLRSATAWVDPDVHLWNRTLLDNIVGGTAPDKLTVGPVIESADLGELVSALPDGLQTTLGEGGGLVSGGEGQRVRLARAMFRRDVRLVILDEAFRGLDRERRRDLLHRSRSAWSGATLVAITHDIAETSDFDCVLVIRGGEVAEYGSPADLRSRPDSIYRRMLAAESELRDATWVSATWRRMRMAAGRLNQEAARDVAHV